MKENYDKFPQYLYKCVSKGIYLKLAKNDNDDYYCPDCQSCTNKEYEGSSNIPIHKEKVDVSGDGYGYQEEDEHWGY